MLREGQVFESPRNGARFEVRESTPERLVFDRLYKPGTGKQDAHVHLDFEQGWEVLSGGAEAGVEGKIRPLAAGESLIVPPGQTHQDIYNPTEGDLLVRWTLAPQNDFIEAYADAFTRLLARGELNDQDEFPMLQLFTILRATRARSYAASPPRAVQRVSLPLLALIGRMRGYRPRYAD